MSRASSLSRSRVRLAAIWSLLSGCSLGLTAALPGAMAQAVAVQNAPGAASPDAERQNGAAGGAAPGTTAPSRATAVLLSTGTGVSPDQVLAGDKAMLEDFTGSFPFAGYTIEATGLSGVVGMSADTAYLAIAAGTARIGLKTARPGQVILLGAFAAEPVISRFDARRFSATLPETVRTATPRISAGLQRVAARQRSAFFFGILRPSGLRVPASGDPDRRRLLDTAVARAARFGGLPEDALEYAAVETLAGALVRGDAQMLGQLIDPLAFGGAGISGEADDARLAYARQLIATAPWAARLAEVRPVPLSKPGLWALQGKDVTTFVTLRRTRDFVFVQAIDVGN